MLIMNTYIKTDLKPTFKKVSKKEAQKTWARIFASVRDTGESIQGTNL